MLISLEVSSGSVVSLDEESGGFLSDELEVMISSFPAGGLERNLTVSLAVDTLLDALTSEYIKCTSLAHLM